VSRIDVAPSGQANIKMRIFPDEKIPSNVGAAIRAKTLFGEKFVELEIPAHMAPDDLHNGSDIPESRTVGPFEVETILEKAVPILDAVDPEQFGAALEALAQGLDGNTQALRNATIQSEQLLTSTERTLPNLERNLVHLQHFAAALHTTDESLLEALNGLDEVGTAIKDNPDAFKATVADLTDLSNNLGDVVSARESDLGVIAGQGAAVLRTVADRANKLPHIVDSLDGFLGVWVADLADGPYWRIYVINPVILTGTPYAPGTQPQPRADAVDAVAGSSIGPRHTLIDNLLAPVPTKDLQRLASHLGAKR
jgi:virulence factor Mce-like protein